MKDRSSAPGGAHDRGLHLEQVSLRYGDATALTDVDLHVDQGETVALTGPSGSGKSSLLSCAAGLLRPTSGTVRHDGLDLGDLGTDERIRLRRERFGFVFQFGALVPELTLRDNIGLPLDLLGVPRSRRRDRVDELLAALDLESRAEARPSQVSGGQAQRAAVARAVAHRPSVVFADEPTGALDSVSARSVLHLLLDLVSTQGTTLVLVTHDPGVAGQLDRVVALHDGALATGVGAA